MKKITEEWTFVTPTPAAMAFIRALADPDITKEQRRRLLADSRLASSCAACEHPGYAHENAERQYETGVYGVYEFEAGDVCCEADGCGCGWYEGDNWQKEG